jgi:hypothetical protein
MRRVAAGPSSSGIPDVHHNDVERPAPDGGHRLGAVADQVGVVAQLGQLEQHQPLVHGVVVGDQDAQRRTGVRLPDGRSRSGRIGERGWPAPGRPGRVAAAW